MSEIASFAEIAVRYCEFIESAHQYPIAERLPYAAMLLADLYGAAIRLPDSQRDEPIAEPTPAPVKSWIGFDDLTLYWHIPDPFEWDAPSTASLSDDLLDIYYILKKGLLIQGMNRLDYAAWLWRWEFTQQWGTQAVNALKALHTAMKKDAES